MRQRMTAYKMLVEKPLKDETILPRKRWEDNIGLYGKKVKGKAVPLHGMEALGGR
jgi:hypothetical protein